MTLPLRCSLLITLVVLLLTAHQAVAFCPLSVATTGASATSASTCSSRSSALASSHSEGDATASPQRQLVQQLVGSHKLVMFMNGSQASPKDKESDDAAKCLERSCGAGTTRKNGSYRDENLFMMVDMTSDPGMRQGLQENNPEWDAAKPQLYANGEFLGGSQTMYKLFYSGDFKRMIDIMEGEPY